MNPYAFKDYIFDFTSKDSLLANFSPHHYSFQPGMKTVGIIDLDDSSGSSSYAHFVSKMQEAFFVFEETFMGLGFKVFSFGGDSFGFIFLGDNNIIEEIYVLREVIDHLHSYDISIHYFIDRCYTSGDDFMHIQTSDIFMKTLVSHDLNKFFHRYFQLSKSGAKEIISVDILKLLGNNMFDNFQDEFYYRSSLHAILGKQELSFEPDLLRMLNKNRLGIIIGEVIQSNLIYDYHKLMSIEKHVSGDILTMLGDYNRSFRILNGSFRVVNMNMEVMNIEGTHIIGEGTVLRDLHGVPKNLNKATATITSLGKSYSLSIDPKFILDILNHKYCLMRKRYKEFKKILEELHYHREARNTIGEN